MKIQVLLASVFLSFGLGAQASSSLSFVIKATPDATGHVSFDVCEATGPGAFQNCMKFNDRSYDKADLQTLQVKADQELREQMSKLQSSDAAGSLTGVQKLKIAGLILGLILGALVIGAGAAGAVGVASLVGVSFPPLVAGGAAAVVSGLMMLPMVKEKIQTERASNLQSNELYLQQNNKNYEYIKAMSNLLKRIDLPQDQDVRNGLIQEIQDSLNALPSFPRESILIAPRKG